MRSRKEIVFRLRQEAANLWLLAAKPAAAAVQECPLPRLPEPSAVIERLRGSRFAAEIERLAALILEHRFPLLGVEIDTGPEIRWRRDYLNKIETGTPYFRFIPYLDFERAGDHKIIWELNRHQHIVVLAQAYRFKGRREYLEEIERQIDSWLAANPYMRGINWASALEVAFRSLSWIWIYHLAGESLEADFRRRFLTELYRHGRYLEHDLSVYFSPNTHLLGEAVALHALGALFPKFPQAEKWRRLGAHIVEEQMDAQVRADGSHFEQSSYYHVYALDLFLLHAALAETSAVYREKLSRMADYLAALMGPSRTLYFLGDDDGGRLFHPYGARDRFGRATLAACAVMCGAGRPCEAEDLHEQAVWLIHDALPPRSATASPLQSRLFKDAGVAVMVSGGLQIVVDAGAFGPGSAGHSHSDTLSIVVRNGGEEILIDPGTYTYIADPAARNWFRSSAAHNTVRIDALDHAVPAGPFRWSGRPEPEIREWLSAIDRDFLDATCRFAGFTHRRRVLFLKPHLVLVLDDIEGRPGEHSIEQFWHLGEPASTVSDVCFRAGTTARLVFPTGSRVEFGRGGADGWRSVSFGSKQAAPVVRVSRRAELPAPLAAALDFSGGGTPRLCLETQADGTVLRFENGTAYNVCFPVKGPPGLA